MRDDLKYAIRQLGRAPFFTIISVLSLAVGIAVAVVVFSMLNSILFKPLPVADADRIVHVFATSDDGNYEYSGLSYPDLVDFQSSGVFTGIVAHSRWQATVAANTQATRRMSV